MVDTKVIQIVIDATTVIKTTKALLDGLKEAEDKKNKLEHSLNTFARTAFRIAGSVLRLVSRGVDISLAFQILTIAATESAIIRTAVRASTEPNPLFKGALLVQAALLQTELIVQLAQRQQSQAFLDRVNAMNEMNS